MRIIVAALTAMVLASCGPTDAGGASQKSLPTGKVEVPSMAEVESGSPQRFDKLTIELELSSNTVQSGQSVHARVTVKNESGESVTDPSCNLFAGRYALIPGDDPSAELWLAPVVDCQGPIELEPGYEESHGMGFPARTKFGDPLAPGRYVAALEIQGFSERLQVPVEVTA